MPEVIISNRDPVKLYKNQINSEDKNLTLEDAASWHNLALLCLQKSDFEVFNEFEIVLSFVTKNEIQTLNRDFRSKDKATDVLSFEDYLAQEIRVNKDFNKIDTLEHKTLGDIIISSEIAQEQAFKLGYTLDRELAFLFIHGVLHLLGYDHEESNEAETMYSLQKDILAAAGYKD